MAIFFATTQKRESGCKYPFSPLFCLTANHTDAIRRVAIRIEKLEMYLDFITMVVNQREVIDIVSST